MQQNSLRFAVEAAAALVGLTALHRPVSAATDGTPRRAVCSRPNDRKCGGALSRSFWFAMIVMSAALATPPRANTETLTAEAAIETARFLPFPGSADPANPQKAVSVSPKGTRYVVRVLRGDVARNGVTLEVMCGSNRNGRVSTPRTVATLFTTGLGPGGANFFGSLLNIDSFWAEVRWLDDSRLTFFWEDAKEIRQVAVLNLETGEFRFLTRSSTHVTAYDVSPAGDLVYTAMVPQQPSQIPTNFDGGITIPPSADAFALFRRDLAGQTLLDRRFNTHWYVQTKGAAARQIKVASREVDLSPFHRIAIAPGGEMAIVNTAPVMVPQEWDQYAPAAVAQGISRAKADPEEGSARYVQQLFLIDLATGHTRPLLDAPSFSIITEASWSPDGESVLIGPAYLPAALRSENGTRGAAVAVIDVSTGQIRELPLALPNMSFGTRLVWTSSAAIEVAGPSGDLHCFREDQRSWVTDVCPESRTAGVRFEVRENLDTPPALFAVTSFQQKLLLDPNPGLMRRYDFGRTNVSHGRLDPDIEWDELTFFPPGYTPTRRYPVVIQAVYGETLGENFTLYGSGDHLGPSTMGVYPGRLLAERGIVVVHLSVRERTLNMNPDEPKLRMRVYEHVVQRLVDANIADQHRIGIIGFSRNGWYVEHTLTHSDFIFAAAIISDNFDPSYVTTLLAGQETTNSDVMGAEPFGDGLKTWLEDSPGFNTDRIRTPLRIVDQSFSLWGAFLRWELFARLRHQRLPTELYMMPNSDRGAHNPQNPQQVMALQQSSIDWFDFWLNDRTDPDIRKAEQYTRWRTLRAQRDATLNNPRPSLLEWNATPIGHEER